MRINLLDILNILIKDPTASFNKIAKKLSLSPTTVKKAYNKLISENLISSVYALVNYPAIDREMVSVFIKSHVRKWNMLENALDGHFYLRSRVRCIGSVAGIHAFFAIPKGTLPYLREFLEGLRNMNLLEDYTLVTPASKWFYSEPDLKYFNSKTFTWNIDWNKIRETYENVEPEIISGSDKSVMDKLTLADFKIIDRLTVNARIRKKELAKFAGLKPYELSRRIKFLHREKVILKYRVSLGPRMIEHLSGFAVNAKCNGLITRKIAAFFKTLPFQSTFIPTKDGFLAFILMTSSAFIQLSSLLYENCTKLDISWLDYRYSKLWNIAYEAYKDGKWNMDYDFMVTKPLETIKQKITLAN